LWEEEFIIPLFCDCSLLFLQVSAQDIQEKFWEVMDAMDVNMLMRWFRNNIVFAIIIFTR